MIYSAGVIVYDLNHVFPHVLCVRAYRKWDFPKGKLDSKETMLDAAYRELCEETSLVKDMDVSHVPGIQSPNVVYGKGTSQKTAVYFFAERISSKIPFLPISPELGRPENDEYRWVNYLDLKNLMPNRLQPVVKMIENYFEKKENDLQKCQK